MDINSLLSPQDSPSRETPPPSNAASHGTPKKRLSGPEHRSSSSLSQQITLTQAIMAHPSLSLNAAGEAQQETPSPTLASLSTQSERLLHSATSTPTVESRGPGFMQDPRMTLPGRQPSTPQMDTLAGVFDHTPIPFLANADLLYRSSVHAATSTSRTSKREWAPEQRSVRGAVFFSCSRKVS